VSQRTPAQLKLLSVAEYIVLAGTLPFSIHATRSSNACPVPRLRSRNDQANAPRAGLVEAMYRHCQLNGPRAPFCGPARLERGSTIGERGPSDPSRRATDTTSITRAAKLTMPTRPLPPFPTGRGRRENNERRLSPHFGYCLTRPTFVAAPQISEHR